MQERNFNHIILEPDLCYGCGACVATCPKKCLKFEKDVLGFRRVQMAKEEDCVYIMKERIWRLLEQEKGGQT